MPIPWGIRKQLLGFLVVGVPVILAVAAIAYFFQPEATCFDRRQNQEEEGVDCGGPCAPCSEKIRGLVTLWSRAFIVNDGIYDAAALLENSNQFLGSKKFTYAFKLYDKDGLLIGVRQKDTFILPGERFLVFEPGISTQNSVPARAVFESRYVNWETGERRPLEIDILRTARFLDGDSFPPRVEIDIKNKADKSYANIEAAIALFGADDEVLGVSRTVVDRLAIDEERKLLFSWPSAISGVQKSEVFFRQMP